MTLKRRIPSNVVAALVFLGAVMMLPRAVMAAASIVRIADGTTQHLASVDAAGNLGTSMRATGTTLTAFNDVTVGGGASKTLAMEAVVGGHLTVFVEANQPGHVAINECVPVGTLTGCDVDFTGLDFAGDDLLHQAADDTVQGTSWSLTLTNTGTSSGTYSLVVVDRPLTK